MRARDLGDRRVDPGARRRLREDRVGLEVWRAPLLRSPSRRAPRARPRAARGTAAPRTSCAGPRASTGRPGSPARGNVRRPRRRARRERPPPRASRPSIAGAPAQVSVKAPRRAVVAGTPWSPPGTRIHCNSRKRSGIRSSSSEVASITTASRKARLAAIRCDRSMASFHSRRKYPSARECELLDTIGMNSEQVLICRRIVASQASPPRSSLWSNHTSIPPPRGARHRYAAPPRHPPRHSSGRLLAGRRAVRSWRGSRSWEPRHSSWALVAGTNENGLRGTCAQTAGVRSNGEPEILTRDTHCAVSNIRQAILDLSGA